MSQDLSAVSPSPVSDMPIIALVDELLEEAVARGASDLHLDPQHDMLYVRMRIDGILHDARTIALRFHTELLARIKVLAALRTDEHQAAQDGRFRFTTQDGSAIDIRVSVAPTYHGENAVLRLLAPRAESFSLVHLGFSAGQRKLIRKALARPHGLILATGPTGSGKTTTLYALISLLADRSRSIITLEDPVEYSIPGITQIEVRERQGLTFANGLRSVLRQDPDILMVGEIRDHETAQLSINAALTGHLVLSTLHTNDAASTLPRLLDMNIEPYLVASTASLVISQRLIRKVCTACKAPHHLTAIEKDELELLVPQWDGSGATFTLGSGCEACGGSGFHGRVGAYEVLLVDAALREALGEHLSARELALLASKRGMVTLTADVFGKVSEGLVPVSELLRIHYE